MSFYVKVTKGGRTARELGPFPSRKAAMKDAQALADANRGHKVYIDSSSSRSNPRPERLAVAPERRIKDHKLGISFISRVANHADRDPVNAQLHGLLPYNPDRQGFDDWAADTAGTILREDRDARMETPQRRRELYGPLLKATDRQLLGKIIRLRDAVADGETPRELEGRTLARWVSLNTAHYSGIQPVKQLRLFNPGHTPRIEAARKAGKPVVHDRSGAYPWDLQQKQGIVDYVKELLKTESEEGVFDLMTRELEFGIKADPKGDFGGGRYDFIDAAGELVTVYHNRDADPDDAWSVEIVPAGTPRSDHRPRFGLKPGRHLRNRGIGDVILDLSQHAFYRGAGMEPPGLQGSRILIGIDFRRDAAGFGVDSSYYGRGPGADTVYRGPTAAPDGMPLANPPASMRSNPRHRRQNAHYGPREFRELIPEYKLEVVGGLDGELTHDDVHRAAFVAERVREGIAAAADVCQLSPPVCEGNMGIPRSQMPQITESPISEMLASEDPEEREKAQAAIVVGADPSNPLPVFDQFINRLRAKGVTFTKEKVPVGRLKATQREIKAGKTFGMADAYLKGLFRPQDAEILVSSDGHILDGHHRYSAVLTATPAVKMNVLRTSIPMREFLEESFRMPGVFRADIQGKIVPPETPLNLTGTERGSTMPPDNYLAMARRSVS